MLNGSNDSGVLYWSLFEFSTLSRGLKCLAFVSNECWVFHCIRMFSGF